MKYIYQIVILFFLSGPFTQLSAQQFEGIIHQKHTSAEGASYDMKWYIAPGKLAYELRIQDAEGYVDVKLIPNLKDNTMKVITKTTKGIHVNSIPVSELKSSVRHTYGGLTLESNKEGIKNYSYNSKQGSLKVNATIDFSFAKYAAFFKDNYALQLFMKQNEKGFPVEIIERDNLGKTVQHIQLISVNRQKLDDSYFK
jgi:hypothetical protein